MSVVAIILGLLIIQTLRYYTNNSFPNNISKHCPTKISLFSLKLKSTDVDDTMERVAVETKLVHQVDGNHTYFKYIYIFTLRNPKLEYTDHILIS